MREKELREHTTCDVCGNKTGHTGLLMFWTLKIERHVIDMGVVGRQDAFATMVGSPQLAHVMGTDEDMTKRVFHADITVCEDCATTPICLAEIAERVTENEEENDG